ESIKITTIRKGKEQKNCFIIHMHDPLGSCSFDVNNRNDGDKQHASGRNRSMDNHSCSRKGIYQLYISSLNHHPDKHTTIAIRRQEPYLEAGTCITTGIGQYIFF